MNGNHDHENFDKAVRKEVYSVTMDTGKPPSISEVAGALGSSAGEVSHAFRRLAEGRVLVLQENGEVLMANLFSAVPTPFQVVSDSKTYWGNCIWDALDIPAMLIV